MARSSLMGIDPAPREAPGRDTASLGPGDSSDSGSDLVGLDLDDADPGMPVDVALRDDQAVPLPLGESLALTEGDTGVRDGADIGVDRVFTPGQAGDEGEDADLDDPASAVLEDAGTGADDDEDTPAVDDPQSPRARRRRRIVAEGVEGVESVPAGEDDTPEDGEALPGEGDPAERRPGRDA